MGKAYSVSVAYDEKTAEHHDRRDYTPPNAEYGLHERNVTILNHADHVQAFNDFFAPAIDRYNAKQKRADRKKSYDYYHDLINGKEGYGRGKNREHPIYEYVLQIGNRDDNGITDSEFDNKHWRELKQQGKFKEAEAYVMKHLNKSEEREEIKEVLIGFAKGLEKRYPNFKFLAIELHDDEPNGTGHLHIAFTPYTTDTKKGLDTRVSLSSALRQMGFENNGDELAIQQWQNDVKDRITEEMEKAGYERQFMSNEEKRLSIPQYKRQQALKDIEAREAAVTEREEDIDEAAVNYGKAFRANRDRRKELDVRERALKAREDEHKALERNLAAQAQALAAERENVLRTQNRTLAEREKTAEEREIFRAARAKFELALQDSVVDASLESYAKNYTRRVPIRERDRLGRMHNKRDKNGKVMTEEHNCYDDWLEHKKLLKKWKSDPYIVRAAELDRQFGE